MLGSCRWIPSCIDCDIGEKFSVVFGTAPGTARASFYVLIYRTNTASDWKRTTSKKGTMLLIYISLSEIEK